ncbi:MAG: redoxin domain-containing protein, partial [Pseudorhodobacter sp.]|nr:redoxin domain-containing protein [Frankiaceae bacterium]
MTARQARVRAPQLTGRGGWIGTGDTEPTLEDFRGRFLLLDFWTFCCVNCLHVLDELRPLEERFADVLTVVGVHSPKFEHEREHAAVLAAVDRYGVHHPVLDDPDLTTWQQYAVRAWPTLVLVDPEGYVVHVASGEGHVDGLGRLLAELVDEHIARGTLHVGDGPYVAPEPAPSELSFPGKALRLPDGTLLVTDTAHHCLVVLDGETVVRRLGTGERGRADGPAPSFNEPQGLCLLPDGLVLVADTANHLLRTLDLTTGEVRTVAGTGEVWRPGQPSDGPALEVALSTPWDVAVHDGEVVVAMAGTHQLHRFTGDRVEVLAGTTGEGLRDGEALLGYLAQPSGLASAADRLWFVVAETSSLRWYAGGQLGTAVGTGLFDFGHRDGPAADALLQHPLGVTVLPDGSVAVCDTYNGAVRRFDPATGLVSTLMTGLAEPSDAVVDGEHLLVVESAAHRVTRLRLPDQALVVDGAAQRTQRPVTRLAPGPLLLRVVFEPPPGQKLDGSFGPSTRLTVSGSPP